MERGFWGRVILEDLWGFLDCYGFRYVLGIFLGFLEDNYFRL